MKYDAYEYIGVIVPGSILVVAIGVLFPGLMPALKASLSLGDFGLLLILAFIAGHLLQAVGNLWENFVWFFSGGMPTSWGAKSQTSLLTADQLERLNKKLQTELGVGRSALMDGRGPVREIVVSIRQHGKLDRIEKFNRNYGLMRGVAAGFLTSAGLALFVDISNWRVALGLCILAAVGTYRMVRFGIHYGREVLVEYLRLPS